MIKLILNDCLLAMKEMPDNSVDSVVTDPPYFLINKNGSGFMGKEWDSIMGLWQYLWLDKQFANTVGNLLKSLQVEPSSAEEFTAQESANIRELEEEKTLPALFATKQLKSPSIPISDSVLLVALTKHDLLDSLKELSPNTIETLAQSLSGVKENALFVIPILLPKNERSNTVVRNVTKLLKAGECQERETTFTSTETQRIRDAIVAMGGGLYASEYTNEITGLAKCVENTVGEKRYSATILFPTNKAELMKNLTLLLYVSLVTRKWNRVQQDLIVNFFTQVFSEVYRVIKPGGHVLAFAGTRTYQYLVTGVENANFEIRDQILWVYSSGFPKSLNIGKAYDKKMGNEREVVGKKHNTYDGSIRNPENHKSPAELSNIGKWGLKQTPHGMNETKGTSKWEGWGTALKPAHEPIVMARKPLIGTVVENVIEYGTGGINIDGCRVEYTDGTTPEQILRKYTGSNVGKDSPTNHFGVKEIMSTNTESTLQGRFPANLIHDGSEEVLAVFPSEKPDKSPARFFYCPKVSKSERNMGCEELEEKIQNNTETNSRTFNDRCLTCKKKFVGSDNTICHCPPELKITDKTIYTNKNNHPCVKPIALMQYLVRLVTPPNGTVLDPFMGSGTTGIAAKREGFSFIGIEREPEYLEIAKARIDAA